MVAFEKWAMQGDFAYRWNLRLTHRPAATTSTPATAPRTLSRGLVEIAPSSDTQVVHFIHQSVKDSFINKGLSALNGCLMSIDAAIGRAHFLVLCYDLMGDTYKAN